MALRQHAQLAAVLVLLLAPVALWAPANSFLHALEHVESSEAAGADEGAPHEPPHDACDVCQSLAQGRAALASTTPEPLVGISASDPSTRFIPHRIPSRGRHAPESPRAPPLS